MKTLGQKSIVAMIALLLVGSILTSSAAKSPANNSQPDSAIEFEDDLSYMDDIEEYVDEYLASMKDMEDEQPGIVKIYDEKGALVLEENLSDNDLSEEATRLIRQAEYLTEYDDTTYYRLNN